jgi:hypothetical protein
MLQKAFKITGDNNLVIHATKAIDPLFPECYDGGKV